MAGLVPAIHVYKSSRKTDVDTRDKPGHDDPEHTLKTNKSNQRRTLI